MKLPILIIGAGGHAAVVADALLAAGERVVGFTDADVIRHQRELCGLRILGDDHILDGENPESLNLANGIGGVGSVAGRLTLQQRLRGRGWVFVSVRHPTAVVSPFARIAEGAQLLAGSVVQVGAEVGEGCIVNTAAVVEHGVSLGAWAHVAPRALLCGDVSVGARSHIGAGAVVRQGVRLGEDTVVGAGAVVVNDSAGGELLVGVPARLVERDS
ncbi:MAG: NeuD/PglB/VioB family sugar acetyltransferase [Proteobacteria bacterium]|nr:NeuD/PglB/VioB family sugar acetyltransferase [Pseudomonadota bacterium]